MTSFLIIISGIINLMIMNVKHIDGTLPTKSLCYCGYCLYSDLERKYFTNFSDYQNLCPASGNSIGYKLWLLEVYNDSVKNLLKDFIAVYNLSGSVVYIPLNMRLSGQEWKWIDNKPYSDDDGTIKNQRSSHEVAYLTKVSNGSLVGYFAAEPGSSHLSRAICQIRDLSQCMQTDLTSNNTCYRQAEKPTTTSTTASTMTWFEAENLCFKLGGSLAVFDQVNLKQVNKSWIQSLADGNYWVGLSKGQYIWAYSKNFVSYSLWKNGDPSYSDAACPAVDSSGSINSNWVFVQCSNAFVVVCMGDANNAQSEYTTTPTEQETPIQSCGKPRGTNANVQPIIPTNYPRDVSKNEQEETKTSHTYITILEDDDDNRDDDSQNNSSMKSLCDENYCLYSDGISRTYTNIEAMEEVCRRWDVTTWMLEVYSAKVQLLVNQFTLRYNFKGGYIALNKEETISFGWIWINNNLLNSLGSVQNDGYGAKVAYVVKFSNNSLSGYIAVNPSFMLTGAICQIQLKDASGCIYDRDIEVEEMCYRPVGGGAMTWYEAQNQCLIHGGYLAVFDNVDLDDINPAHLKSLWDGSYWVGLSKGYFIWDQSKSMFSFSRWKDKSPNSGLPVTAINTWEAGYWENVNLTNSFTVVCMKAFPTTTGLTREKQLLIALIVMAILFGISLIVFLVIGICFIISRKSKTNPVASPVYNKAQDLDTVNESSLATACNDRYCLYSDLSSNLYNSVDELKYFCTKLNMGLWLLEVHDSGIQNLVNQFVKNNQMNNKFIPLNLKFSSLGWTWIDNRAAKVSIQNENVSSKSQVAYVTKFSNNSLLGYYAADPDSTCSGAICQIQTNDDDGCAYDRDLLAEENCYRPVGGVGPVTWYEAENQCTLLGGSLAVLDGVQLEGVESSKVQSLADGNYWVGLSRGRFMWDYSNSFASYTHWKSKFVSPMYPCTAMNTSDSNLWFNMPCSYTYTPICMKTAGSQEQTTTLKQNVENQNSLSNQGTSKEIQLTIALVVIGILFGITLVSLIVITICYIRSTQKNTRKPIKPLSGIDVGQDVPMTTTNVRELDDGSYTRINTVATINHNTTSNTNPNNHIINSNSNNNPNNNPKNNPSSYPNNNPDNTDYSPSSTTLNGDYSEYISLEYEQ
ncbi:hypothetical protein HELRODRAFT_177372 [Helobdella robusta]|uniref:C-type lectin domain-containing protein n=1 Tax=Helobdella robusta TaxID=6412 RepID=T1FBK9_HELRO|nr:hypothetical protein HELRODRAFT_177372 [Helobdella robusta]ESN98131.1 hypothetical protein HELRODRAFT_177372 [Helobdella robusta]